MWVLGFILNLQGVKLENVGNLNLSSSISNWFTVQRSATSVELQVLPPFDASRRLLAIECYGAAMQRWRSFFVHLQRLHWHLLCCFLGKNSSGSWVTAGCRGNLSATIAAAFQVCTSALALQDKQQKRLGGGHRLNWKTPWFGLNLPRLTLETSAQKTEVWHCWFCSKSLKFPQPTSARVGGKSRSWALGKMGDCGVMLCFLGWTTTPRNEHSKRWRHPLPLEFHDLCFRSFERFRRHHVFQWSLLMYVVILMFYDTGCGLVQYMI